MVPNILNKYYENKMKQVVFEETKDFYEESNRLTKELISIKLDELGYKC
jgi:hypothetical protein